MQYMGANLIHRSKQTRADDVTIEMVIGSVEPAVPRKSKCRSALCPCGNWCSTSWPTSSVWRRN